MNFEIQNRIDAVRDKIKDAAILSKRDPSAIKLIVVTKYASNHETLEAIRLGSNHIGESRVQEAISKKSLIPPTVQIHMIGPLQSNKVKHCIDLFALIHSIDRLSLMQKLNEQARAHNKIVKGLLQVNIGDDPNKSGCKISDCKNLLKEGELLNFLKIEGLMTVLPYNVEPEYSRVYYKELLNLKNELNQIGLEKNRLNEISAGMSHDYHIAIEEGATMVRVGSAIFK
ncbi:MAG: YggS family pyridoxal phosphate-dependent enzyme [Nitrospinota bacterium]